MEFWTVGVAGLLLGSVLGGLAVYYTQRNKGGGKTAGEIHAELNEYRQQVQEHFDKTSDLFRDMTHQYRELYDHLSVGAQSLCEASSSASSLHQAARNVLPKSGNGEDEGVSLRQEVETESVRRQEPEIEGAVAATDDSKHKNTDAAEPGKR